jgi:hypothetical protein
MTQRRTRGTGTKTRIPGDRHHRVPEEQGPEAAQRFANHESPRATKLYDRRQDEMSLDEVERIAI